MEFLSVVSLRLNRLDVMLLTWAHSRGEKKERAGMEAESLPND